jgi:hypothetical protein
VKGANSLGGQLQLLKVWQGTLQFGCKFEGVSVVSLKKFVNDSNY